MKSMKFSKTAVVVALGIVATGLQLNRWPSEWKQLKSEPAKLEAAPPGDLRTAVMETCGGCHANATFTTAGAYSLLTGAAAHAGGVFAQSQSIDPTTMVNGDPITALIVQKPLEGSSMAHGGIKIPQSHPTMQAIINWVQAGAPAGDLDRPAQPAVQYVGSGAGEHHILYIRTAHRPQGFRGLNGGMMGGGGSTPPDGDIWRARFRLDTALDPDANVVIENVNVTNLPDTDNVADPSLSLDGTKIVFSRKQSGQPWHIWEIGVDGTGLRQITSGSHNCVQPVYLPYMPDGTPARSGEGGIMFGTDEPGFRDEYETGMTLNFFVCDANGANKRQISFTPSHEMHPTLHSSGAMLFTRWEHNEHQGHNFMPVFSILASDTDSAGTNLFAAYGEHHTAPIPMVNSLHSPKELFGAGFNGEMVAIASRRDDEAGSLVGPFYPRMSGEASNPPITNVISQGDNLQTGRAEEDMNVTPSSFTWRRVNTLLSADTPLIASRATLDGVTLELLFNGTTAYTYTYSNYQLVSVRTDGAIAEMKLAEFFPIPLGDTTQYHFDNAIPLISQPTPDKIGKPIDRTKNTGIFTSGNVTERQSDGQPRNFTASDLSVVRFIQGIGSRADVDTGRERDRGMATQIMGEAPIFPDGSFAAEVTAEVPVQFQIIDRNGRVLVSHKPWVQLQKGETMRCVGCHANHSGAPQVQTLLARQAPPSALGTSGLEQFSYENNIQKIWDSAGCVSCHDSARVHGAEAGLSLSGRRTPANVTESYEMIVGMRMMNNMSGWQPLARTQRSRESRLMHVLTETNLVTNQPLDPALTVPHANMLTPEQLESIQRWIDTGLSFRVSGNPANPLRSLDVSNFTANVWPHLNAMCFTCHSTGGAGVMAMDLTGDTEDAESEEDLMEDRAMEVAFRSNFSIPNASTILRKPLGESLGGLTHAGGQVFSGFQDPGYLALYNWIASVNPALDASAAPSTDLVNVKNYPNPFRDVTTIVYGLVGSVVNSVEIKIYSQNGKLIRELPATNNTGGSVVGWNRVDWDGHDKNGKEVGNDVYFYSIEAKFGDGTTKKIKGKCVKVK